MAVFDHARRCLRRRLSVVMVGRRACRMHLRCRFIVVVMVIAHLHGGSRLGWRVVVRWRAGWMLVARSFGCLVVMVGGDRSEEHTSELQSLMRNSYAVFCLK